jgi:hypothetical protein
MRMPSDRKAGFRMPAAFIFLFVCLAAGAYYVPELIRLQDRATARESRAALQGISDPAQIEAALAQHPTNKILRLLSMAARTADETRTATDKLSGEIEPPSIPRNFDFGKASRGDLEALRNDLKTAETNAIAFLPRYVALFKTERDKVENYARSLHVDRDTVSSLLAGIEKRHAKAIDLVSRRSAASADYYRAYEKYVVLLAGEFGSYKVIDGQFIFPLQRTVERYNAAANAMTAAAKRIAELDEEGKTLQEPLQQEWEQIVNAR